MSGSIFGEFSKDGYGYWGYVATEKRMMLFVSPEEYREYISDKKVVKRGPQWKEKRNPFCFNNFYNSYNEGGVKNHENTRT